MSYSKVFAVIKLPVKFGYSSQKEDTGDSTTTEPFKILIDLEFRGKEETAILTGGEWTRDGYLKNIRTPVSGSSTDLFLNGLEKIWFVDKTKIKPSKIYLTSMGNADLGPLLELVECARKSPTQSSPVNCSN